MTEVRCPGCGQMFEGGEPVRVCDGCQAAHHQEGRSPSCWESEPRGCKFCGGRQGHTVPFGKERKASEHGIRVCPFRTWIPGAPEEGQPCLGFRCVLFRADVNPPTCALGTTLAGGGGGSAPIPEIRGLEQRLDRLVASLEKSGTGGERSKTLEKILEALGRENRGGDALDEVLEEVRESNRLLTAYIAAQTRRAGVANPADLADRVHGKLWSGMKRLQAGHAEAAERDFRTALELTDEPALTGLLRNAVGAAQLLASDPEAAEQTLREALSSEIEPAAVNGNLGAALARQGRWDEARERLLEACRRDPDDARHRANLGIVDFASGDVAAARENWLLALRLDPWNDAARESLEQVRAGPVESGEAVDPLAPLEEIRAAMPDGD